jgi:hypothetical protein
MGDPIPNATRVNNAAASSKTAGANGMEVLLQTKEEIFVYTRWGQGAVVPCDVVHAQINSTIRAILDEAFEGPSKLREVKFDNGLQESRQGAFRCCMALTEIISPPSLTAICNEAFAHCKALIKVKLNEGLLNIGVCSFCWYCSLGDLDIPTANRMIGNWALGYANLKILQLHDGLESIGQCTFRDCKFANFRSPPQVTTIPNMLVDHGNSNSNGDGNSSSNGNGDGKGNSNGNGNGGSKGKVDGGGNGNGNRDSNGNGNGDGEGKGKFNGNNDGNGNGSSNDNGNGNGDGNGDGDGDGNSNDKGDGNGKSKGDGDGNDENLWLWQWKGQ